MCVCVCVCDYIYIYIYIYVCTFIGYTYVEFECTETIVI